MVQIKQDILQKQYLRQQLLSKLSELETIKIGYLLGEKAILSILNKNILQSPFVVDDLNLFLSEIRQSYQSICEVKHEILQKLNNISDVQIRAPMEREVLKNILHLILLSMISYLKNNLTVQMDTSDFRKIVVDMATMIKSLDPPQIIQVNKQIVLAYLMENFDIEYGQKCCRNCGKPMLNEIPYCLNCYGRN